MKILVLEIENNNINRDEFKKYGKEEAAKLWELYKKGVVRENYFSQDKNTAVLILETKDLEEAKAELSQLPFVKNKLITFEFIPLKPYSGMERLFK